MATSPVLLSISTSLGNSKNGSLIWNGDQETITQYCLRVEAQVAEAKRSSGVKMPRPPVTQYLSVIGRACTAYLPVGFSVSASGMAPRAHTCRFAQNTSQSEVW